MNRTASQSARRAAATVVLVLLAVLLTPAAAGAADPPVTLPSSGPPASTLTSVAPTTTAPATTTTTATPQPATRILSINDAPPAVPLATSTTSPVQAAPPTPSAPQRQGPQVGPASPGPALTGPLPVPVDSAGILAGLHPTPVDPTVPTSLHASTTFLYSGDAPVQAGVVPGTIERRRAAVLRGAVHALTGTPLPGVHVSVRDHPEFGHTLTRQDGMFDLAVNGGGSLIVTYDMQGLTPAQRRVDVGWGEYAWVPDVTLVAPDEVTTTLPSPAVRGEVHRPGLGAALLVAEGTRFDATHADGTTEPLSSVSLRSTQLPTMPAGRATLPVGPLPEPAPAYLVRVSVDEARQPGTKSVSPSRPLVQYVRGAPGVVPLRRYDAQRALWVPAAGGRAVAVVGVTDSVARLDLDGDGDDDEADGAERRRLGITEWELTAVASVHPAGTTLWRLPLDHLGTWAVGTETSPPATPKLQVVPLPTTGKAGVDSASDRVPVAGTAFVLRSERENVATRTMSLRLTGTERPPGIEGIEVLVTVAGTRQEVVLTPTADQIYEHIWDGFDAYGRKVQGRFPAVATVTYLFGADRRRSPSQTAVVTLTQSSTGAGLDGWAIDVQAVLDVDRMTLHAGDGQIRDLRATTLSRTPAGDAAPVGHAVAAGPDGALYLTAGNRVLRVGVDGVVTTLAGSGGWGFSGDGGPAALASFRGPGALAVAPDGAVLIVDRWNHRVRRISPDGTIATVAGDGGEQRSELGFPATGSSVGGVDDVAVTGDGRMHLLDGSGGRVFEVGTDGILRLSLDLGPAGGLGSMAAAPDGSVLVAERWGSRIVRVGADGLVTTAATLVASSMAGLAVTPDGGVAVIADGVVHRVAPDGTATIAPPPSTIDDPAAGVRDLAASPDGVLHVATGAGLRSIGAPQMSAGPDGGMVVRSEDSWEELVFDVFGRHLRTVTASTGENRLTFGYDGQGRMAELRDAEGQATRIERNPAGGSLTLVAAQGERTTVAARRNSTAVSGLSAAAGGDIPAVALQAYRDAAEAARQRLRCDLRWPVLAAIGRSESGHGRVGGATVLSNGGVVPAIVGIPLDGRDGVERVADTDGGALDGDRVLDRAVGPMQFLPESWRSVASDGNGDGVADVQNVFDAALGAARYLCRAAPSGRLTDRAELALAVRSYNHSSAYVAKVLADMDMYASLDPGLHRGLVVGAYALPVDRTVIDRDPAMLDQPHHDYAALDFPLPIGSPVYAVAGGRVTAVNPGGRCGNGLVVAGADGHSYAYCHADSVVVGVGTAIVAGQLLMRSGNSGNSEGPHLHLQIERPDGTKVCPQALVRAWYSGEPRPVATGATTGCVRK